MKKILMAILGATFVPYIILCYYVTPAADDFSYADASFRAGWLQSQLNYYTGWTGRYTATFVQTTAPRIGDYLVTYKVYPFLLLCLSFISIWTFFSALQQKRLFVRQALWPATFLLVVYINSMPTVVEGIYWLSGAYTYQLGNLLAFSLVSLLLVAPAKAFVMSWLHHLAVVLIGVLLAGTSEIVSFMTLSVLFAGVIISHRLKSPNRHLWSLAFLVVAVCFLVVFLAPGNTLRSQHFPKRHNFSVALDLFLGSLWAVIKAWFFSPFLMCSAMLMLPYARRVAKNVRLHRLPSKYLILAGSYISFIFLGAIFLPCWAMGNRLPIRTGNIFLMILIIGIFFLAVLVSPLIERSFWRWRKHRGFMLVWMIFIALLLGRSNFTEAASDLAAAGSYKALWEKRYELVRKAKVQGLTDIALPPINYPDRVMTISYYDFTLNHEHWTNKAFARYFGFKTVRIRLPEKFLKRKKENKVWLNDISEM